MSYSFTVIDKGLIDYQIAWKFQELLFQHTIKRKVEGLSTQHYVVYCEHHPVYTFGKRGKEEHLLLDNNELEKRHISVIHTDRGGDITFHGLGQIVGYLIFDLEDIGTDLTLYLRNLEEIIIRTLSIYGIQAGRSKGETGVWIAPATPQARKICAMGIRCSRWVTMHGFALNVHTDLSYFNHIIPCGIHGKQVSSMQQETNQILALPAIKTLITQYIEDIFFAKNNLKV